MDFHCLSFYFPLEWHKRVCLQGFLCEANVWWKQECTPGIIELSVGGCQSYVVFQICIYNSGLQHLHTSGYPSCTVQRQHRQAAKGSSITDVYLICYFRKITSCSLISKYKSVFRENRCLPPHPPPHLPTHSMMVS